MSHFQPTTESDCRISQHGEEVARQIQWERDLIQLCARGARSPTITNLLKKEKRLGQKVKEYKTLFHGGRKDSKPRGNEYYVESPSRRRDASLIVSLHHRLSSQEKQSTSTYIKTHEMYMQAHSAPVPYDIDELIKLIASVELEQLKTDRCPECGALVVMKPSEFDPRKVCFICKPIFVSKARVRASAARPLQIPPPEDINKVVREKTGHLLKAWELVSYGARPQEIEALLPGTEQFARDLWPEIHGTKAKQGPLPYTPLFYIEKIERRRHAAFIIKTYRRMLKAGLQGAEPYMATARAYLSSFAGHAEIMHFSRIYSIIRMSVYGRMRLAECDNCKASYAILDDELPKGHTCPTCRIAANAQKEEPSVRVLIAPSRTSSPPLPGDLKRKRSQRKSIENLIFSSEI